MRLTQQQLEAHLWGAANILRGKTAGQDYKNYILSLMFYKRLCDQWENEADEAIAEQEKQQGRLFSEGQKAIFRARGENRFNIPDGSRWGDVLAVSENIGQKLTEAMRAVADANEELRGVFTVDWNQPAPDASGKKLIPNEVVHALIQHFDEHNLSNRSVPPDILGRAYEYLIKQFADAAGAKAGEFDDDGNPIIKRRKADDEHLIRQALLQARLIDAVISLPLNVLYGAGVPACLLILRKQRPPERHDQVLLIYAARHYRELSNQNELCSQDVMRMLVHVHAYGDAAKVPALVAQHSQRIREQINQCEQEEVERLEAEYAGFAERLAQLDTTIAEVRAGWAQLKTQTEKTKAETALRKLESQRAKPAAKVAERTDNQPRFNKQNPSTRLSFPCTASARTGKNRRYRRRCQSQAPSLDAKRGCSTAAQKIPHARPAYR